MLISRRSFLKNTGIIAGLISSVPSFAFIKDSVHREDEILYAGALINQTQLVCKIDLVQRKLQAVPVHFNAHSFCPYPGKEKNVVLTTEKWGPSAAIIDFSAEHVIPLTSDPGTLFFGHGVFLPSGKAVFLTQVDYATGKGHLIGLDPDTGKKIADYVATPGGLHECHMISDHSLIVTSSGIRATDLSQSPIEGTRVEKSSLVRFDLNSGKVLDKMFIDSNDQMLNHFVIGKNGSLTAITSPYSPHKLNAHIPGEMYVGHLDKSSLIKVDLPSLNKESFSGEFLSAAIDASGKISAATHPASSTLFLIDTEQAAIKKTLHVEKGTVGVAYDTVTSSFITTGAKGFSSISLDGTIKDLRVRTDSKLPSLPIFLSHSVYV
jgi:hypothetical protein